MKGSSPSHLPTAEGDDQPSSESAQSDRDLTLVNWELYSDHLEVVVRGGNLPTGLWIRFGDHTARLLKRGLPTPDYAGSDEVPEACYANALKPPLTEETYALADQTGGKVASATPTYELRRGDKKGRLVLGLPEAMTCQQADHSGVSIPGPSPDQLDRDLKFVNARLHPGYLEVIVAGSSFPTRIWARLGSREVRLLKRSSDKLDAAGVAAPKEARYAGRLAPPLSEQVFSLDIKGSGGTTAYQLRRGDHKGRLLLDMPATIACRDDGQIVSSSVRMKSGQLIGWLFDSIDPATSIVLELHEPTPSDDSRAPGPVQPIAKAVAKGRRIRHSDSGGVPEIYFTVPLPAALLDGAAHELHLTASSGECLQTVWRDAFQASSEWIEAQIRSCGDDAELRRFLIVLAEAGRLEEIARCFADFSKYSERPISIEDTFYILANVVLIGGHGQAYDYLYQKFQELGELHFTNDLRQRAFLKAAISFLNSRRHDASLHRFPHAPLAEAALDFVFVLEDTADSDLLRDLIFFCIRSRRYLLARQLADRWMRRDTASAAPRVTAASIELALANVEGAERLVNQALDLKPNFREALLLLARIYAMQGRPLHAAAACSGGRGLSRWLHSTPGTEEQSLLAALDWHALDASIARRTARTGLLEYVAHADDLHGRPEQPADGGFSLVFLDSKERDTATQFEALRGVGCVQVVGHDAVSVSEIEGIGRWTLIIAGSAIDTVTSVFVEAVFAQRRPYEPIVRLMTATVDSAGRPEQFFVQGALVRTELLQMFGSCALDEFIERAMTAVRVKTILV